MVSSPAIIPVTSFMALASLESFFFSIFFVSALSHPLCILFFGHGCPCPWALVSAKRGEPSEMGGEYFVKVYYTSKFEVK